MTHDPWNLTDKQRAILTALVEHGNAKGVAAALGTSHRSACNMLRRCFRRMGVMSDVQAALKWDRWTRQGEAS